MGERRQVTIPYRPRPAQQEIHDGLRRFNVLVCHRRFGKTVLCINEIVRRAVECRRPAPRYAYIAPQYRHAKRVAWDYLKAFTRPFSGRSVNEAELRVDLPWGSRITLLGAENPDALRGAYFDGIVLDEFGLMDSRVWREILRPAPSDRQGWAIFIGTPKGRNAFWSLYDEAAGRADWHRALYRASDTGILSDGELAAARQDMTEDEYAQEFECSFDAAIPGTYYGRLIAAAEREGRVTRVPWEPTTPVHTAWDLGIDDATSIWFLQVVGPEIRWIDHYESSGVGLDHYARTLLSRPYVYGDHLLPHDAKARELGTGRSRMEVLARLGLRPRIVGHHAVEDGIGALRAMLPRSWFDAERCVQGLEALRHYRCQWNERSGVLGARPVHDWSSHAADAARTAAMGLELFPTGRRPQPNRAESDYDILGR